MSRCVSDQVLLRLFVGEGTVGQRAHVAECVACAERAERVCEDVRRITQALVAMPPARSARSGQPRAWLPALGLAAVAVSIAVWVSVTLWRPPTPVLPAGRATEVASLLRDVSTVMFSISGDPSALGDAESSGQPGTAEALDRSCDGGVWLDGACSGLSEIVGAIL
jgi:hypothetical protein